MRHSNELLGVPLRRRDGRGMLKRGITIKLEELPERAATQDRAGRGGLRAIDPTYSVDQENQQLGSYAPESPGTPPPATPPGTPPASPPQT